MIKSGATEMMNCQMILTASWRGCALVSEALQKIVYLSTKEGGFMLSLGGHRSSRLHGGNVRSGTGN